MRGGGLRCGLHVRRLFKCRSRADWDAGGTWTDLVPRRDGVAGFLIGEALKFARDWRIERKNSIRGRFETTTSGTVVRAPGAPQGALATRSLRVSQRGDRIHGVEVGINESNVTWELRGQVTGEYVVGTYWQTFPASVVERGAFHLERDPHDRAVFRGLWVGWNPETHTITSDTYVWRRLE